MKLNFLVTGAIFIAATLSSCFEMHNTVTLNKDGSGQIKEEAILLPGTVEQINAMNAPKGQGPIDPLLDAEQIKSQAKTKFGEVNFVSVKQDKRADGSICITTIYDFQDINKIKVSALGTDQDASSKQVPIKFRYADGTLVVQNDGSTATIPPISDEETDPEKLEGNKIVREGMKTSTTLVFPKGIKSTNATFRNGDKITLSEIDIEAMMTPETITKFKQLKDKKPEEIKKITDSIKGLKVETKPETEIKLK